MFKIILNFNSFYKECNKICIYLKKAVLAVCKFINKKNICINISIKDSNYMCYMNSTYRDILQSTDVLSFEYLEDELNKIKYGDIFINEFNICNESNIFSKTKFIKLCIHGILHILGLDHKNKKERTEMFYIHKMIKEKYKEIVISKGDKRCTMIK